MPHHSPAEQAGERDEEERQFRVEIAGVGIGAEDDDGRGQRNESGRCDGTATDGKCGNKRKRGQDQELKAEAAGLSLVIQIAAEGEVVGGMPGKRLPEAGIADLCVVRQKPKTELPNRGSMRWRWSAT